MGTKMKKLIIVVVLLFDPSLSANYSSIIEEKRGNLNSTEKKIKITETESLAQDKFLNTTQLLNKYGYSTEEHFVITEDGYNLTVIRIPGTGPSVFIMHGLLGCSDDFVTAGPHKGLAYFLANASYDVWLGNARGNVYSRRHIQLDPSDRLFWQFSWHEIGYFDLPAMINHTLLVANKTQLTYIGHSQGTTVFYVMASLRPEYNEKIALMISLATIAWTWHSRSVFLRSLVPIRSQLEITLDALGYYEFLPRDSNTLFITSFVCSSNRLSLLSCATVLFNIAGFDYKQLNLKQFPIELSHLPAGSALWQSIHYLQLTASKRFAQYDFEERKNQEIYGTSSPPDYPVQNVTAPVVIFYGENDFLATIQDIRILVEKLPNVLSVNRVPYSKFNHYDFLFANDVIQLLYSDILNVIKQNVK